MWTKNSIFPDTQNLKLTFISDKSSALLSPVSLVVLIGCVFVFIVGIVTLAGFIIHRKREQRLLESDSYNASSPSFWLSDFNGGITRSGTTNYWTGEHPLDITSSSSTDLRRQDNHPHGFSPGHTLFDFRRLKDQRRRSFHATSMPRDCPDVIESYPMQHLRSPPNVASTGPTNYISLTCPGYKCNALNGRLPRYGAASTDFPDGPSIDILNNRSSGVFYTGTSAYP